MHHKICHVLGGMFNLPHAQTHAVVLPDVLAFNVPNAPEAAGRIAAALNGSDALSGLLALRDGLDAPRALRELGLAKDDLPSASVATRSSGGLAYPRRWTPLPSIGLRA